MRGRSAGEPDTVLLYGDGSLGEEWTFPTASLAVILIVVAVSLAAAVHHPVRRVRRMSVVETIIRTE